MIKMWWTELAYMSKKDIIHTLNKVHKSMNHKPSANAEVDYKQKEDEINANE